MRLRWRGTPPELIALRGGVLRVRESERDCECASEPPHAEQYGYGFGVMAEGSLRGYGHSGGAPSQHGDLRIYPELGYLVVAPGNVDGVGSYDLPEYFAERMPDQ
jgi:hypothetical protein